VILPEGRVEPGKTNIRPIDGVNQHVDPGRYHLHFSFPRNIKCLEKYRLVDNRKTAKDMADNFAISGALHVDPMQVGGGGAFTQQNVMQSATSAGSGHLEAYYFEPKAVFGWHPEYEVPSKHWGKEFIRLIVVGAEARATIAFSRGEERRSETTGDRVNMKVSANPEALAMGIPNGSLEGGYSTERAAATKQGPVAADVELEGFGPGVKPYKGQPVEVVLNRLRVKFHRLVANAETWKVLCIETCANEKAQEEEEVILMVGNPGTGKSTLLNCYAEANLFKSGIVALSGLTYELDKETFRGRRYLDTPGLNDALKRKQAAEAITLAMRQEGHYRLFFVMTLKNGRLLPEDVTTMNKVLEAAQGQLQDNSFGVIFNQVTDAEYEMLMKDEEQTRRQFEQVLFTDQTSDRKLSKTKHIFFNRESRFLIGRDNIWEPLPMKTRRFINSIQGVKVAREKVEDIRVEDWDDTLERERQLTAAAEAKIKELEEKVEEERLKYMEVRKHLDEQNIKSQHKSELNDLRQQGDLNAEAMTHLRKAHNSEMQHWREHKESAKFEVLDERLLQSVSGKGQPPGKGNLKMTMATECARELPLENIGKLFAIWLEDAAQRLCLSPAERTTLQAEMDKPFLQDHFKRGGGGIFARLQCNQGIIMYGAKLSGPGVVDAACKIMTVSANDVAVVTPFMYEALKENLDNK